MKAADIMTTKLITIDSLATIAAAAKKMKEHQVRALIVDRISEEDAYGIITTTDISRVVANGKNPEQTYVCEVMTKPCIVVNPDLSVEHIAQLFARAKIRIAPVIKDQLLGIVSLTDVLTKTNNLDSAKAKLTSPDMVLIDEIPEERSMENEWNIEPDNLYENWCSG